MLQHSPRPWLALVCRAWAALALVLCAAGLAGCGQGPGIEVVSETDEKPFHDAKQLLREDRPKEALAAFLRVIKKRPDDAPESHLEAGQLYLKVEKNPVLAIYHFQEYLVEKPKSEEAAMVRGLIDTAKKEFARSLPGQPNVGDFDRLELQEQIKNLRAENEDLHRQLAQAGHPPQGFALENVTPIPVGNRPLPPVTNPPTRGAVGSTASVAVAAPKSHTVESGDNLFNLAKKYGTTVAALRTANNLKSDSLRPGQVLKIP